MVGVEDQRLARKPEVVVPEVEPRDDIPADPRQETTRRETLDQAVAGGRQLEPAAVAPGEEDVVVLVAQELRRQAERGGPVGGQIDVLESVELVEEADPFEAHPGGLILCFQDAEAAVLGQGDVARPADGRQGRERRFSGLDVEPVVLEPEAAHQAAHSLVAGAKSPPVMELQIAVTLPESGGVVAVDLQRRHLREVRSPAAARALRQHGEERPVGVDGVEDSVRAVEVGGAEGPATPEDARVEVLDSAGVPVQFLLEGQPQTLAEPEQVFLDEGEAAGRLVPGAVDRCARLRRPDVARVHHHIHPAVVPRHRLDAGVVVQEVEAPQVALRLVQDVRVGRVTLLEQELAPDDVFARLEVETVGPDVRQVALVRVAQVEDVAAVDPDRGDDGIGPPWRVRSEEHTSELQSLTNLVCRLLLEKKKQTTTTYPTRTNQGGAE